MIILIKENKATICKDYTQVAEITGKHRNTIARHANDKNGMWKTKEWTIYFNVPPPERSKRGGKNPESNFLAG